MRIALCAEGTRGDVHPMLGLGEDLAARGHEVVVCAPPDFAADVEARGLGFRPVGLPIRERLSADAAAFIAGPLRMLGAASRWLGESVPLHFAELPDATRDADRIVAAGVQLAAASCAERHGVPYRYIAYCPILLPSDEHPPFMLPWRAWPPGWNRAAWRLARFVQDRALGPLLNRQRAGLGLPPVRDLLVHLIGEAPILAADAELGPAPRGPFTPVQVPCLHRSAGEPIPPKLEAFLASGPAPVYLGFGSMVDPDPTATTRQVLAAVARLGCRALLAEGWAGLGDGALPEGVMRVGRVDHAQLFPRAAAVVHHGGAGTTTLAARSGVPQVVIPHLMDQFYWGERMRALGVAPPPLRRRHLTAMRLASQLDAVLDNEWLADRAAALGERLCAAADPSAAVDALLAD